MIDCTRRLRLAADGPRGWQVLLTETGWATHNAGLPTCTEQEKADWTVRGVPAAAFVGARSEAQVSAYRLWASDPRIMGVMPFMLQVCARLPLPAAPPPPT